MDERIDDVKVREEWAKLAAVPIVDPLLDARMAQERFLRRATDQGVKRDQALRMWDRACNEAVTSSSTVEQIANARLRRWADAFEQFGPLVHEMTDPDCARAADGTVILVDRDDNDPEAMWATDGNGAPPKSIKEAIEKLGEAYDEKFHLEAGVGIKYVRQEFRLGRHPFMSRPFLVAVTERIVLQGGVRDAKPPAGMFVGPEPDGRNPSPSRPHPLGNRAQRRAMAKAGRRARKARERSGAER